MNIAQFLKDYGELISITLIPFILWFVGIQFQNRKSKKDAKLKLFLTLMANRKTTTINKEWVDSLNQIDVVFQDNKKIRASWLAFFDSLHPKSQHFENKNSFHLDLLSEIANDLGYKDLKQTEIDRFYNPQAFGNQELNQGMLLSETLRVLNRSKAYGVAFPEDEYQNHVDTLYNSPQN